MLVKNHTTVPLTEVTIGGAVGCRVRWLIEHGNAPTFAMREFEIAPGGRAPKHYHQYEHEVFILSGQGVVIDGENKIERPIVAGDVVFIGPNEKHGFRNTGSEPLRFLCMIPNIATSSQIIDVPDDEDELPAAKSA
ncbi:MAG TPA: cupin domain-containing protein [Kofleriaceae bacterium]|nr:cupin domain-containing protein [Kofleriaceae bacterium]